MAPPMGVPTATISNVPGPPMPLYTAGARMESMYPMSVLVPGNGLNITVVSYMGNMDFGFTCDPDLIPDPWYLAEGVENALRWALGERGRQGYHSGVKEPGHSVSSRAVPA